MGKIKVVCELRNERSLTTSAVVLTVISAIGIILSFVKESVIAFYFGTSSIADAYVVAVDLPLLCFSLFSSAISVVVIPNYTKVLTCEGQEKARIFFSSLVSILLVVGVAFSVLLIVFGDVCVYVAAPGLPDDIHDVAVQLFCLMIPASVLLMIVKVNSGVLNVHGSFALPALGDLVLSGVFIVIVLTLAQTIGVYAAVFGSLFGALVETAYSVLIRRKYIKYYPIINFKDSYARQSVQMATPVFFGIAAAEINALIDKAIASSLSMGGISALHYAAKISTGISNLLLSSVSTVLYPEYAKKAALGDDEGMAKVQNIATSLIIIVVLPLIFGGYFLREEIVTIVYGRGAFDANSMSLTAPLLVGYLVSMLFTSVRHTCTNMFNAYGETKIPVINTTIGIAINIVLNIVLSRVWGVLGLVVATAIANAISAGLLMVAAKRKNAHVCYKDNGVLMVKSVMSSGVMLAGLYIVREMFPVGSMGGMVNAVIFAVTAIVVGCILYFVFLVLIRTKEIELVLGLLRKKVNKRNK